MAPTGRGGLRPYQPSKFQPFVFICMFVTILVIGFNLWNANNKNSLLLNEVKKAQDNSRSIEASKKECGSQLLTVEASRKKHELADKQKDIVLEDTRRIVEDLKAEADQLKQNITKLMSQMTNKELYQNLKENRSLSICMQKVLETKQEMESTCEAEKEKVVNDYAQQMSALKQQLKLQCQQELNQVPQRQKQENVGNESNEIIQGNSVNSREQQEQHVSNPNTEGQQLTFTISHRRKQRQRLQSNEGSQAFRKVFQQNLQLNERGIRKQMDGQTYQVTRQNSSHQQERRDSELRQQNEQEERNEHSLIQERKRDVQAEEHSLSENKQVRQEIPKQVSNQQDAEEQEQNQGQQHLQIEKPEAKNLRQEEPVEKFEAKNFHQEEPVQKILQPVLGKGDLRERSAMTNANRSLLVNQIQLQMNRQIQKSGNETPNHPNTVKQETNQFNRLDPDQEGGVNGVQEVDGDGDEMNGDQEPVDEGRPKIFGSKQKENENLKVEEEREIE